MTERKSRGSQPRCILLTDGGPFVAADNLTRKVVDHSSVIVSPSDRWRPEGRLYPNEVQLDKPDGAILVTEAIVLALQKWWPRRGRSPNWDIASTCTINKQRGLVLVEAKAHTEELDNGPTGAGCGSREKIAAALAEANDGLRCLTGEDWALSADRHYQLANRVAWSWKLATLDMPTVLVYLGFLDADEMKDQGRLFTNLNDWENCLFRHCNGVVPPCCWNRTFDVDGTPLMFLTRVCTQPLKAVS